MFLGPVFNIKTPIVRFIEKKRTKVELLGTLMTN
jgi:hypothetical protein